jgi:stress response protein SCP2
MQLAAGQNAPVSGDEITVDVSGPVDLTALVLSDSGKVSGDEDMVFFNQPSAPGLALVGSELRVSLPALRTGADKVVLVASPEQEDRTFGQLPPPALTVRHHGEDLVFAPGGLSTETALVLCEVYRRNGTWKLRAVGQGYDSGLAGVATDFGIQVDEEPEPVAVPPAPAPAAPAIDLTKRPLGAINLAKSGSATIPMTKEDKGTLRLRASLRWTGRRTGSSDLDLYALYVDSAGREKAVYYKDKGRLTGEPYIQLDKDSRGAGEENLTVVAGHHRYVLLCAYSALGNGVGAFKSYNAHVVVDDGAGSQVTVPLYSKNKFSYWVAIALLDFTDPSGARVVQIEQYGKNFSERRPLLHADGRIEMSKGPIEFKGR